MKSNTWTIVSKEFARFFGDRQLLFTTIIMPGLLIYIIYSLMGSGIESISSSGADRSVVLRVDGMPQSVETLLRSLADSSTIVVDAAFTQTDIDRLNDKNVDEVLLRFPPSFDASLNDYDPQSGELAPNVEIYYNSTNNASARVFATVEAALIGFENSLSNRFDINRADSEEQRFNQASDESIGAMVWSKILPMFTMMMLFSAVMAIAPSSIAGEKERGTIATLLVTPMHRSELALGKVISISCIALLSGISSFAGIALSLPKMISTADAIPFHYQFGDYALFLLIIFVSVLILASAVCLLSTLAKDVKNAGTMVTPFMLVVMLMGLLPMFQTSASSEVLIYLIPFYNSIEVMTALFLHEVEWIPIVVTVASNIVYTAVAVWGMTRMFNNEKVMFGR